MKPEELLQKFVGILPGFDTRWHSAENCFVDKDGRFTLHGVCTEFSRYVQDQYQDITPAQWEELFDEIEFRIRQPGESDPLDNALCTCFLENISSTQAGEAAKAWMGPKSRLFFDAWHDPP
jgi:hypothetical protein